MFEIPMQSAFFILLVSFLIGLLGITFMGTYFQFKYRGLLSFILYYLLKILGICINNYALFIPEKIRLVTSNVIVYVAVLFLYVGLMKLFDLKYSKRLLSVVSILITVIFSYYILIDPNIQMRIIVFSLSIGLTFSVIIIRILRAPLSLGLREFIIPVTFLLVVNAFIRTGRAVYSFSNENIFLLTQDGINVVIGGLLNIMLLAGLYGTIASRVVYDLEKSNQSEKFFLSIYSSSPIPVIIGKLNGTILHFNDALAKKLDIKIVGENTLNWHEFCCSEDASKILEEVALLEQGERSVLYGINIEYKENSFPAELILHRSEVDEDVYEVYIIDLTGNADYIKGVSTLNKAKEGILGSIPGFAYRCKNDEHWSMELLSDSFNNITGYQASEVIDNKVISYNELVLPEYRNQLRLSWDRAIAENKEYIGEYQIRKKDGSVIWVWERGKADPIGDGETQTISGFISDITYRKEVEGALEYLSYHDSLTGLYNRRFMIEELNRLDVKRNLPFTLVQLDINNLKFMNDAFGHAYGDKLINKVASILKESLRQDEIVGRMGGDEFLILLPKTTQTMAEIVVQRILDNCKKAILKTRISVAIGAATKLDENELINDVLQVAEEKMYSNKIFHKMNASEELVEVLLEELYLKHPEQLNIVNRSAKLIVQFSKHLNLSSKQVEIILKACRVHKIGLLSDSITETNCIYRTEETYRMIRSIPDFEKEADIIKGFCEHYDGNGHPNGLSGDDVSLESQVLALCSYIAMNGLDGVSIEIFKKGISDLRGAWFAPEIIDSYIEMLSK